MDANEKRNIQYKLRIFISSFNSQKKACAAMDGVSEAVIISMLSDSETMWDKISDAMWRNVGSQVGGIVDFNKLVETGNFKTLFTFFQTAKEEGATFAVTGDAGYGKSYAAKWYASTNRKQNVYLLECSDYWNKKTLVIRLAMQLGKTIYHLSISEMMEMVSRELRKKEKPLIILDEIDKLPDAVFRTFISLYNELNKHCGFVWLSTDAIEKRFHYGLRKNMIGYKELYSRIGGTFIPLQAPAADDVIDICKANGITDKERIAIVVNEVKDLGGDLRRVDRNILKNKLKNNRRR